MQAPFPSTPDLNLGSWPLFGAIALAALLFFIWPIPHTTSVRELLLVICLAWFAYLAHRSGWPGPIRWGPVYVLGGLYVFLSLWIVFVAIAISPETAWSLDEIRGQWLKATVALAGGGLLAIAIRTRPEMIRLALIVMTLALLVHMFYVIYQSLDNWSAWNAPVTRVAGFTDGPDKSNYLTNMLLYFLLAEIFIRLIFHRRFFPVGKFPLMAMILLALFAIYVEGVRNGLAELAVIFGLMTVLAMHESDRVHRRIIGSIALVLILIVLVMGYLNVQKDERWRTFIETVPISMDIENNRAWISESMPQPRLESGATVDWSNYSRIARIRAGLSLIAEHPLGVGFGRNAFGHAVEAKYGLRTSHSHSGIIDLGVGIGIPGVLLWLAFLGALWRLGYRGLRETQGLPALALLFLTTGYGFRMLVDSTIRDHMLQMFLFLAAFLAVTVTRDRNATGPIATSSV